VSNPANLVIFGKTLPSLLPWLRLFMLPSVASIAVTFAMLWLISRRQLAGGIEKNIEMAGLEPCGRRAVCIAVTGAALIAASAAGRDLGVWTFGATMVAVLVATGGRGLVPMVKNVSWSVLPLIAGLLVIVEALQHARALDYGRTALQMMARFPAAAGSLAALIWHGCALKPDEQLAFRSAHRRRRRCGGLTDPPSKRSADGSGSGSESVGHRFPGDHPVAGSSASRRGRSVGRKVSPHWLSVMPPALLVSTLALLITS
jgi:hypothetical protein